MRSSKQTILIGALSVCAGVGLVGRSTARADYVFGTPTILGQPVNSTSLDFEPHISPDGLSLYFASDRPGGQGDRDIWVTTRATVDANWNPPVNLGPVVNSPYRDHGGCVSPNGLELYLVSFRPGGYGGSDLWVAKRMTTNDPWGTPTNLGPVINCTEGDYTPSLSADGLSLYYAGGRSGGIGGGDIWVSTRSSLSEPWGEPVNLGAAVNSSSDESSPSISNDGLALFFCSWRTDVPGFQDLYLSLRPTIESPWGPAVNLGVPINTTLQDVTPCISPDGLTLYFASLRAGGPGGGDIWQVPIIPMVDFNGDGVVDLRDLLRMIRSWGKDDRSVDIGPGPWGDRKIDRQDLEVLMSYWGQEVYDPSLMAYWKFNETGGTVAADSGGMNDGTVIGNPTWEPTGGKLDGALLLDGSDDCVTTGFVCNPDDGPFSVFAWVSGGAPGQVIISQRASVNWLTADLATGALATELKQSARMGKALTSSVVITDGAWHRVGLVWDGSHRSLYVDDIEVARDTQPGVAASISGLHIGAGTSLAPGTFWSGLIDDVRIYDRAVQP